jgi:hypothetical protein
MSPLAAKAQSLKFESNTPQSTARRPKGKKNSRRSSRRRKNHKPNKMHEKRQTNQNGKEELRKLETKIERVRKAQTQKLP